MARASLDRLHGGAGDELQYLARLEADVLHAQMAGDVIENLAERLRKISAQLSCFVAQDEVFEGIEHVIADFSDVRIVGKHERQFLLEHQCAGGNRRDNIVTALDHREQRRDVPILQARYGLQVAHLELGHAAAILPLGERNGNAVMFEDTHQIESYLRLVAIDIAGSEQSHFAARAAAGFGRRSVRVRRAPGELLAKRIRYESRQWCIGMNVQHGIEQFAPPGALAGCVDRLGDHGDAGNRAHRIGRAQQAVAQPRADAAMLHRFGAQHEMRKVDVPRMRRDIGTFGHETHVAQVAMVDHAREPGLVHGRNVTRRRIVDQIEQGGKSIAQAEAAPAAVANIEDAR